MSSIERKFLKHLINATPNTESATYEVLGKDLEEYNIEMNPEVETKKNILGENSVKLSSYEPQASAEPYYAEDGTKLHTFLQDIIDKRKVLDDLKTDVLEVHLWEETETNSGVFKAFKDEVIVEISSYGGDTTGYQIPFNLHYTNVREEGTYDTASKKFTPTANVD